MLWFSARRLFIAWTSTIGCVTARAVEQVERPDDGRKAELLWI
jgi:hypothetical protein